MAQPEYVLGIDYGAKRIGVAIAHGIARLPRPLTTLDATGDIFTELQHIVRAEDVLRVVVGLPRSMDGTIQKQGEVVEAFIEKLQKTLDVPITVVDETLTSVEAEQILDRQDRGIPGKKGDIDAVAAALILERYFNEELEA